MTNNALNHVFKHIWSHTLNAWVVVSEITRGKAKSQSKLKPLSGLVNTGLLSLVGFSQLLLAGPEGGQVTNGVASIDKNGHRTTITQSTPTMDVNWHSFNVASGETVNFIQPSATALAVNHILDSNGSRILGNLNANGQVWLINPNGVFFGQGAQVNVGSLLASTLKPLNTSNNTHSIQDFGHGGTGSIEQQGTITATGYVALLGNQVSNKGTIVADNGTVAMGAGSQVRLTFADNKLLSINVDESTLNNLIDNQGLIQANGGAVFLSAGAKDSLLASVVNHEGVIEAKTTETQAGKIILLGGMAAGTTTVKGKLDASAPTGNGGFIETSAAKVNIHDQAVITTRAAHGNNGEWLIDPYDFTIAATGGNLTGQALSNALQSNHITIQTLDTSVSCSAGVSCGTGNSAGNGDIHVNDAISWSSNSRLTLNAHRNIAINDNITALGVGDNAGKLSLVYGQGAAALNNTATVSIRQGAKVSLSAGDHLTTKLGADGTTHTYTVITALGAEGSTTGRDLQGMRGVLAGNFALGADIDASSTSSWQGGAGFLPIGSHSASFTGRFEGLGHTIVGLALPSDSNALTGLFGVTNNAVISHLNVVPSHVSPSHVSPSHVSADQDMVGLVGVATNSPIAQGMSALPADDHEAEAKANISQANANVVAANSVAANSLAPTIFQQVKQGPVTDQTLVSFDATLTKPNTPVTVGHTPLLHATDQQTAQSSANSTNQPASHAVATRETRWVGTEVISMKTTNLTLTTYDIDAYYRKMLNR